MRVLRFNLEGVVKLVSEVLHLLQVLLLVSLQGLVDFLSFVDCVLAVVFDALVDVAELLFQFSLCLVSQAHHVVELVVDLINLALQPLDFQILLFSCVVHFI